MHDQNITVQRYSRPAEVGWRASVTPADRSWALFIPNDPKEAPKLHVGESTKEVGTPVPVGVTFDLAPATFGEALEMLRAGKAVQRAGWNGKGMFLVLYVEWEGEPATPTTTDEALRTVPSSPFIAMVTADRKLVPWLASQTDILATDWSEVTPEQVLDILDNDEFESRR